MRVEMAVLGCPRPNEPSGFRGRNHAGFDHSLSLICQLTSEDIYHFIVIGTKLMSVLFSFLVFLNLFRQQSEAETFFFF